MATSTRRYRVMYPKTHRVLENYRDIIFFEDIKQQDNLSFQLDQLKKTNLKSQ